MVHKLKSILLLFIIVAICVILFSSCRDVNQPYVYKPNDELYEYCAFDSSSYWIYEDSATLQIDSVVATKKIEKISSDTKMENTFPIGKVRTFSQFYNVININEGYYREVKIEPFVYYNKPEWVYYIKPERSQKDLKPQELYVIASSTAYQEDYNIMFLNWFYMNISTPSDIECYCAYPDGHSYYKYSEYYDTIRINDCNYTNVKKIELTIYKNDTIVCYWASKIGMVRWEYHSFDGITSQIKNLISYNVINVQNQYE